MAFLRRVIAFGLLMVAGAQDFLVGARRGSALCPKYDVVSDFKLEAYLGKWYTQAVTELFYLRFNQTCTTAKYSPKDNATIVVDNSGQKGQIGALEPRKHTYGTAKLADPSSGKARLLVSLTHVDQPYDILKTDYTSYAIIYSCQVFRGKRLDSGWLLTREVNPVLAPFFDQAKVEFSKVGVDFDAFHRDVQGKNGTCTYDESQISV